PRPSTLLPYTTLFRSGKNGADGKEKGKSRTAKTHRKPQAIRPFPRGFRQGSQHEPERNGQLQTGQQRLSVRPDGNHALKGAYLRDRKSTRLNSSHVSI